MALDFSNMSRDSLATLQHDQLIAMVLALHESNEKLKKSSDKMTSRKYDLKLEQLQREMNKTKQHIMRDTITITGISQDVQCDDIENNVKVGKKYATNILRAKLIFIFCYILFTANIFCGQLKKMIHLYKKSFGSY